MTPSLEATDDRRKLRRRAGPLFLLLLLQVGIPVVQLGQPRPARFGWQMFSGVRRWPQFWAVDGLGHAAAIDLTRFLGNPRTDIEIPPAIWRDLCVRLPGSRAIRVEDGVGGVAEHACP